MTSSNPQNWRYILTQEPFADPYRASGATGEEPLTYPADDLSIGSTTYSTNADSTSDVAKDQAAQVGQGAADAGKQVAGVAKDQASNVAGEAKAQAQDLAEQARSEMHSQAHTQKQRATEGLRSIGQELGSMADKSEQPGTATDLARRASQAAHDAAEWLEQRDPGDLLDEIRSFARRRPGAFLGIAGAAGVVAGRLTRGMTSSGDSETSPSSSSSTSGLDHGAAGYSAPAYGRTATGATYATDTQLPSEYPADYPVDGDALSRETR